MNDRALNDRRVHVTIVPFGGGDHIEIVRYDRAGKWWYESGEYRRPLTFDEAVGFADKRPAVIWHEGIPGGSRFDTAVSRKWSSSDPKEES